jgi:ribosomal protein S27AE
MAIQICPKCKEESFVWSANDHDPALTDWHCGNCGYTALEIFENVCETCDQKTKSYMKDDTSEYWWCSSCNEVRALSQFNTKTKIHEDLAYFFKHGNLRHIPYGIPRNTFIALAGDTSWQHFTSTKDRYPSIYKYGRLEFYFDETKDATLHGIQFQPLSSPGDKGNLILNYHRWTKQLNIEKAMAFLDDNHIGFEERQDPWNKDVRLLVSEGGVRIFFDDQQEPAHFVLHKAGKYI